MFFVRKANLITAIFKVPRNTDCWQPIICLVGKALIFLPPSCPLAPTLMEASGV